MGRPTSCLERKDSKMSYDPQLLEEGAIDKDSSLVSTSDESIDAGATSVQAEGDIDFAAINRCLQKFSQLGRLLSTSSTPLPSLCFSASDGLDIEAGTIVAGDTSARIASASGPSAAGDVDFGRSLAPLSQKHVLSTAGSDLIQHPSSTSAAELDIEAGDTSARVSYTPAAVPTAALDFTEQYQDLQEASTKKETDETLSDSLDPKSYLLDLDRIHQGVSSRVVNAYHRSTVEQYIRIHLERSTESDSIDMDQLEEDAEVFAAETMKPLIEAEMSNITMDDVTLDECFKDAGRRGLDAFQAAEDGFFWHTFCNHDMVRAMAKDELKDLTPEDIIINVLAPKIQKRIEGREVSDSPPDVETNVGDRDAPITAGTITKQTFLVDQSGYDGDSDVDWSEHVLTEHLPRTRPSTRSATALFAVTWLVVALGLLATVFPTEQDPSSRDLSSNTTSEDSDSHGFSFQATAILACAAFLCVNATGVKSFAKFALRKAGYNNKSKVEGYRAPVTWNPETMIARGGDTMVMGGHAPAGQNANQYRGHASIMYQRQLALYAAEASQEAVDPSALKYDHHFIATCFQRFQEAVPGAHVVFKKDENLYKCNDTAFKAMLCYDLKYLLSGASNGYSSYLVPGAMGTAAPNTDTTVCLGPGTGSKTQYHGGAAHLLNFYCREKGGDRTRSTTAEGNDPKDGVSITANALDDVLDLLQSRGIEFAFRAKGSPNFIRLTDDGARCCIKNRIKNQIKSILYSTKETYRPPPGLPDPAADLAKPIIMAHRLRFNAGQHQPAIVVRTGFFSDEPCCKGDACMGSGFLTYNTNGRLYRKVNPNDNEEYMCQRCYDAQDCNHGVPFRSCRESHCNGFRCTKHNKWSHCCLQCHPMLTITTRRRCRRRGAFNALVVKEKITEQDAQGRVTISDAQLATELGLSIEGWGGHLLATYNGKYDESYGSLGEIQAAGIDVNIDEIVGCCNWTPNELSYCFHWKNSQLLKAEDNLRKTRYVSTAEKQAKKDEIDQVV